MRVISPGFRPFVVAAIVGVSVLGFSPAAIAAGTDIKCSGDQCDEGRWGAARGDSFWGMYSGHNCTNYVAWRLSADGVAEPPILLGNAATWAQRAASVGIAVDHTPAVGAVAQWDAYAAGNGYGGHVAYIEAVNDDGTLTVSEDYWHGGNQLGPLTFRTVPASNVSNIIHFDVSTYRMRTTTFDGTAWREAIHYSKTRPDLLAAVAGEGGAPLLLAISDGRLVELASDEAGTTVDTGVVTSATSFAAVTRGSTVYAATVEDGTLVMNVRTAGYWQRMWTGLDGVAGDIDMVDDGGLGPSVLLSQAGSLYIGYLDPEGWHLVATGVSVSGPIHAVAVPDGVDVFSAQDGVLMVTHWDGSGWTQQSTGMAADAVVGSTVAGAGESVTVVQGDSLHELVRDGNGWRDTDLQVAPGRVIATVAADGAAPMIVQAD